MGAGPSPPSLWPRRIAQLVLGTLATLWLVTRPGGMGIETLRDLFRSREGCSPRTTRFASR